MEHLILKNVRIQLSTWYSKCWYPFGIILLSVLRRGRYFPRWGYRPFRQSLSSRNTEHTIQAFCFLFHFGLPRVHVVRKNYPRHVRTRSFPACNGAWFFFYSWYLYCFFVASVKYKDEPCIVFRFQFQWVRLSFHCLKSFLYFDCLRNVRNGSTTIVTFS